MRAALSSINTKLLLVPLIAFIASIGIGVFTVQMIAGVTRDEYRARARTAVEAAVSIVKAYETKAASGEMTDEAAQDIVKTMLRALRYGNNQYISCR